MAPIIALVGPTATGKTELALHIANHIDCEIVNADALQVYRGFDIGTAKPTPEQLARAPHHLIDVLEADQPYSAGSFAEMARPILDEIRARERVPMVVGGSGLYLRALLQGIGPLPPSTEASRRLLRERLEREGLESLWNELDRIDHVTAQRLPKTDTQRILRALEVFELSGRPLSRWIAENPFGDRSIDAVQIGLTLPRALLYDRIASRVERMIQQGWVDEVARLLERWKDPDLPAFQAIGYRQIARHLLDDWPLEAAIAETVHATRRFAKRQLTWFKREPGVIWHSAENSDEMARTVLEALTASGLQLPTEN